MSTLGVSGDSDILIFEKLVIFHIGAKILGGEYFDLKKQKF